MLKKESKICKTKMERNTDCRETRVILPTVCCHQHHALLITATLPDVGWMLEVMLPTYNEKAAADECAT